MMVRLLALAGCMVLGCATAGGEQPPPSGDAPAGDAKPDATVAPDANGCSTQPCDILPQCGCAAATPACDIDGSDLMGSACRAVATAAKDENGVCSDVTQCKSGLVCLGGFCKKYCTGNTDCVQPRGQCVIDIVDGSNNMIIPGIPPVCSSNCDPTSSAGVCGTAKCGIFTQTHAGTDHDISDCTTAGTGVQGTNCKMGTTGDDALCAANFLCTTVDSGTTFGCRKVCVVGGTGICTGAQTCLGFNPALTIGGTTYGACN